MSNDTTETPRYSPAIQHMGLLQPDNPMMVPDEQGQFILFIDHQRELAKAKEELDGSDSKRKETAKDFETAFRVVRIENDSLKAELARVTKEREDFKKLAQGLADFPDNALDSLTEGGDAAVTIGDGVVPLIGDADVQSECAALRSTLDATKKELEAKSSTLRDREEQWRFAVSVEAFMLKHVDEMVQGELMFDALVRWHAERFNYRNNLTATQSKLHSIASLVEGYVNTNLTTDEASDLANAIIKIIGSTTKPAALLEAEAKVAELTAAIEQDLACHMHQHGPCSCSCERALRRALSSSPSDSELFKDRERLDWLSKTVSDGGGYEVRIRKGRDDTIAYQDHVSMDVDAGSGPYERHYQSPPGGITLRSCIDAAITAGRKET